MTRTAALLIPSLFALPLSIFSFAAQPPPATPLTVEAIYGQNSLTGDQPAELTWSPDGRRLTCLEESGLMEIDPATGMAHVLVSRALLNAHPGPQASEQDLDHRSRYGMASYQWAPGSDRLLFDSNGELWLDDLRSGKIDEIGFAGESAGDDPKFSPDGAYLSFIRSHGLAVLPLHLPGAAAAMVAPSPGAAVLNGEVDWIYDEELSTRSNYFWSPDSKHLAYLQMDETRVPEYPLTDWIPIHATVQMQRYPQPGDPNPAVRVGVVRAQGGKTVWISLPLRAGDDYIPRFGWVDDETLWIETLSRDQKHRDLFFADAATGRAHPVLKLRDRKFFDDQYDVFAGDGAIVLTDWSDGTAQIYLYSYDRNNPSHAKARLERQLTRGAFDVATIDRVDFAGRFVDYASNEGNPLEQQLWQVGFDGQRKQLSAEAGFHDATFAARGTAFVDQYSARMQPPELRLCRAAGACLTFWQAKSLAAYRLRAPEQLEVKAQDGTTLYATLLLPPGKAAASVPLIVNPYGGPGSQDVVNSWTDTLLFDELLAEHGFAVLHADNRGMSGRGRAFAQAAYHDFGPVQLGDQLTVVNAVLARYPQLDPKRLGWWGWSWGGTFTLYALSHSDRFRAGIAVAPVTDWRDYDSIYTERYLGDPAKFAAEYQAFSVINSVSSLKGRLLLAHGTGDDNVHLENTVQYVQKLIEAGLPYDLQIYPRKTHAILGADVRTHLFNRILAQFEMYLMPPVVAGGQQ
ncbi:MAG: alpha/beta fold hydrolase [Terracidiphilus sp.]